MLRVTPVLCSTDSAGTHLHLLYIGLSFILCVVRHSAIDIVTALRAGRYGYRIPVEARFSVPAALGSLPGFYTTGTGSLSRL